MKSENECEIESQLDILRIGLNANNITSNEVNKIKRRM